MYNAREQHQRIFTLVFLKLPTSFFFTSFTKCVTISHDNYDNCE